MDVATAIEKFLAWCRENHSPGTSLVYGNRLKGLASCVRRPESFSKDSKEDPPFSLPLGQRELTAFTRADLDEWLYQASRWAPDSRGGDKRAGQPKAPDTIRGYAIAFKAFQEWAVEFRHLVAPVATKIKKPMGRFRERIPRKSETVLLLANAPEAFQLIYEALRRSGARPNELCKATIADWDREERAIVLVEHKTAEATGRARRITVGKKLEAVLLRAIGDRTDPGERIFLTPTGRPWSPNYLSKVYKQLRNKAGLPSDLVLYLARHEHGTVICRELGINAACDALGHTSIDTTRRYLHSTNDERATNQDAFE